MEIGGTRLLLPLADIVAAIEPTAMEVNEIDPDGIWIGRVRSHQGVIAVASGSAVIRAANTSIAPGRIAILRGEYPVGLAVDRTLSVQAVSREALLPLPSAVPCIESSPVSNVFWIERRWSPTLTRTSWTRTVSRGVAATPGKICWRATARSTIATDLRFASTPARNVGSSRCRPFAW
ncbi:hypothetical protein BH23CHL2_BH23CHL2_03850 [soil metagenome]